MTAFEDLIIRDITANRPAASKPGRLFYDTTLKKWQRDTGVTWEDCEPDGLPPTGSAGGDLSGTYPNPNVAKIGGVSVTIDTDGTLAANSDAKLATQKAVKTYVDNQIGGGLTASNTNISPTTTNITATITDDINYHSADVSGLTADRNFVLPAGTAGKEIVLNITVGDDTYELVVIGDTGITINGGAAATAWGRLFVAGESVRLIATSTSNWQVANYERRSELDYVEFTSNVNPTATTEATANTIVTGSSVHYDGATPIIIEFKANNARPAVDATNRSLTFWLYEDGSSVGQIGYVSGITPDIQGNIPIHLSRRLTPSAGSHTYSIRASVSAGTGLVAAGAGGAGNSSPGYIRIVKANP